VDPRGETHAASACLPSPRMVPGSWLCGPYGCACGAGGSGSLITSPPSTAFSTFARPKGTPSGMCLRFQQAQQPAAAARRLTGRRRWALGGETGPHACSGLLLLPPCSDFHPEKGACLPRRPRSCTKRSQGRHNRPRGCIPSPCIPSTLPSPSLLFPTSLAYGCTRIAGGAVGTTLGRTWCHCGCSAPPWRCRVPGTMFASAWYVQLHLGSCAAADLGFFCATGTRTLPAPSWVPGRHCSRCT
jgi:hypothetical protein